MPLPYLNRLPSIHPSMLKESRLTRTFNPLNQVVVFFPPLHKQAISFSVWHIGEKIWHKEEWERGFHKENACKPVLAENIQMWPETKAGWGVLTICVHALCHKWWNKLACLTKASSLLCSLIWRLIKMQFPLEVSKLWLPTAPVAREIIKTNDTLAQYLTLCGQCA